MKLLHIGLGKAGSTALQKIVFPIIAKITNSKYININDFINFEKVKFNILENEVNFQEKLPERFILSNEGLFSKLWNFDAIEESFNLIKKNFHKDTVILLFIREPYEYLNSVFCQRVARLIRVDKKKFFINTKQKLDINLYPKNNDKNLKQSRLYRHFNLFYFSYTKLINLYKSHFNKVIVVKYENIKKLDFLDKIMDINKENKRIMIEKMNSQIYHQSTSAGTIKAILFCNKYLNIENFDMIIKGKLREKNNNFYTRFRNKLISKFLIENFCRKHFNKLFGYKKYYIEKDFIPIDLKKLEKEYKNLIF